MQAILFLLILVIQPDHINKERLRWSVYYVNTEPKLVADSWLLPFLSADRKNIRNLKVISTFGAPRDSYLRGHIHTAIDSEPLKKSGFVDIYPMANGVVCSVHLADPQLTIVIKHKLPDGRIIFTSYKHLKESYVRAGQQVDPTMKIARLFTATETRKFNGNYDHLHLEIRKKFDDYGCASWLTMTRAELESRFYEPQAFIREHLKR